MRRFELINAKYGDISITKNRSCFINVTGKCSITGTIPLPIHILHRVNEYYHYLKIKPTLDTPLILNGDLQKYTNKQLNNIDYENFKIGAMIHEARLEKGLTQEELADKVGTTKSYISKIENAKGNIQLSTLIRIFEKGLNRKVGLTFL